MTTSPERYSSASTKCYYSAVFVDALQRNYYTFSSREKESMAHRSPRSIDNFWTVTELPHTVNKRDSATFYTRAQEDAVDETTPDVRPF